MKKPQQGRRVTRALAQGAAFALGGVLASAQTTTRVSVDSGGGEGDARSDIAVLSRSGRFVAFESQASNLVANDQNSNGDIFVHDRLTGLTKRVSVDSLGAEGDGPSREPAISADGRFVAFQSAASNLVVGDTNMTWDVFVHDCATGITELASRNSAGVQANFLSGAPALSADGRYLAFASVATNLVPGDTNNLRDIFVRDLLAGTTVRASLDSNGVQANGASDLPSLRGDGLVVAFQSSATNLVPGDTNGATDVFLRDLGLDLTERVSLTESSTQANGSSSAAAFALDGLAVAFQSTASNLVAGDTNNQSDVFLRDLVLPTTQRISVAFNSAQPNAASERPSVSADGVLVAFVSSASNLVAADTNNFAPDLFLFDRASGTTSLLSLSFDQRQVTTGCDSGALAADGHAAVLASYAFKLVPFDENSTSDVFVRDFAPAPLEPLAFCSGDGSATPCPCANDALPGTVGGCLNSLGLSANLSATGTARVGLDSLLLVGANLPNSTALFLQGTQRQNGGVGVLFGDGLSCLSGTLTRLGLRTVVGNTVSTPPVGGTALSVRGNCLPGDVRQYQIYYRNSAAFCTPETFNLSNGLEVTWTP